MTLGCLGTRARAHLVAPVPLGARLCCVCWVLGVSDSVKGNKITSAACTPHFSPAPAAGQPSHPRFPGMPPAAQRPRPHVAPEVGMRLGRSSVTCNVSNSSAPAFL